MIAHGLVLCLLATAAGDPGTSKATPSVADRVATLKRAHQEADRKFDKELTAAGRDDAKVRKANDDYNAATTKLADELEALIRTHGKDPAAFEGVLVLVGEMGHFLEDDLVELVRRHHRAHPRMGHLCFELRYRAGEDWAETLLRDAAASHPDQAVRGQATYALGDFQRTRARPFSEKRSEADAAKWLGAAGRCYADTLKLYPAVPTPDGKARLGDLAAAELTRLRNLPNLKVGKPAPDIEGEDLDGKPLRLSDYRGKVVVLDFWGHW
jgi:hypothetical protein